jgi:hypothetical protein
MVLKFLCGFASCRNSEYMASHDFNFFVSPVSTFLKFMRFKRGLNFPVSLTINLYLLFLHLLILFELLAHKIVS